MEPANTVQSSARLSFYFDSFWLSFIKYAFDYTTKWPDWKEFSEESASTYREKDKKRRQFLFLLLSGTAPFSMKSSLIVLSYLILI
jgi:hypothetical protein